MPARGFGVEQMVVSCMRSLPAASKDGVRPQWPKIRANIAATAPEPRPVPALRPRPPAPPPSNWPLNQLRTYERRY